MTFRDHFSGVASDYAAFRPKYPPARFLGFVQTWSAVGRYHEEHGEDPVAQLAAELEGLWGNEDDLLPISWRLDLRAGRV